MPTSGCIVTEEIFYIDPEIEFLQMHLAVLAAATGYLGAALGVAMVVPQIMRTLRNRQLPGVSALSWALTAIACTTWLLYGVRTAEIPQIPGNVLLVSGAVAVVLVVPSRVSTTRRALGLAGAAVVVIAVAYFAPAALLGAIGGAIGVVSGLPQLVRSLRRTAAVSAVSATTWALRVASQASWLSYGLLEADWVVAASATFLMTNAVLVLVLEMTRRPAAAVEPTVLVPERLAA
jgi:uncharacterized protein with PQ loop repeat